MIAQSRTQFRCWHIADGPPLPGATTLPAPLARGSNEKIVERDGVCGFRLMDTADVPDIRSELFSRGRRFDTWDVFLAKRNRALLASSEIVREPLPSALSLRTTADNPESEQIKETQAMMAKAGLVPFSGSMLTGEIGRSVTVIIGDEAGIVATAHGYMPHNAFSPYRGYAWGGLVAVTETHRDETMPAIIVSSLRGDKVGRHLQLSRGGLWRIHQVFI